MQDNAVVEKWNPISSAEMAVGVRAVLRRVIEKKPRPFDFDDSLTKGVEFLGEACDGGAIICGESLQTHFTGTLSPFMVTMRYIKVEKKGELQFYEQVVSTLRSYKKVLECLLNKDDQEQASDLKAAHIFFSTIAEVSMRQADPALKSVSRPLS